MSLLEQTTTTTTLAAMPRVNLLPPEIGEHRRSSQLRLVLAGVIVVTAAVIAGLYVSADRASQDAAAQLQLEQDRSSAISREAARYAAVPRLENEAQAGETSLRTAMAQEVRWSYFLGDLSSIMPADVWLTSMTMTQPLGGQAPVAALAGPGGSSPGIASLTYAGNGRTYPSIATWLEAQEAISTSDNSYVTTTAETKIGDEEMVEFTTTATINAGAYSHRYDTPQGIRP